MFCSCQHVYFVLYPKTHRKWSHQTHLRSGHYLLGLKAAGVPEEKVQRFNCIKMRIYSPSPSCRSRDELWLRGREVEAPGASAACAQETGTTWETRGRGGWGEQEGTGAVDAGYEKGRERTGGPAPADGEEKPAESSKEEESERGPSGPADRGE